MSLVIKALAPLGKGEASPPWIPLDPSPSLEALVITGSIHSFLEFRGGKNDKIYGHQQVGQESKCWSLTKFRMLNFSLTIKLERKRLSTTVYKTVHG